MKQNCLQESVGKMSTTLNKLYKGQPYYRRALNESILPSAKRSVVPAVQKRVIGYVRSRSRKTWPLRWMHPRKSAEWFRSEPYASVGRDDSQQVLVQPRGSSIGLPEEGLATSVLMLDVLAIARNQLYSRTASIGTLSEN